MLEFILTCINFPFISVKVSKDMLSEYCIKISKKYGIPTGVATKLIPILSIIKKNT